MVGGAVDEVGWNHGGPIFYLTGTAEDGSGDWEAVLQEVALGTDTAPFRLPQPPGLQPANVMMPAKSTTNKRNHFMALARFVCDGCSIQQTVATYANMGIAYNSTEDAAVPQG